MQQSDIAYLKHDGIRRESKAAVCYRIHGRDVSLPRSQIVCADKKVIGIPKWLLTKKGLERDW